jgi:hypothetical protein
MPQPKLLQLILDDQLDPVVFKIFESGSSFMETIRITSQTAVAIRHRFAASPGRFTCIPVGKDDGVKLRRNAQVKLEDVLT